MKQRKDYNHLQWISRIVLLLLLCVHIPRLVNGKMDSVSQSKTVVLSERHFNSSKLNTWRNEAQYQYDKVSFGLTWWERLKMRFWNYIARLLSTKKGVWTFWGTIAILSLAIILFAIIRLTGKGSRFFERTNLNNVSVDLIEEDIHEIDFDARIKVAMAKNDFRLAVRLYYLYMLRLLSEREWIKWHSAKTYGDYCVELGRNHVTVVPLVKKMGRLFDIAWYSEQNIDEKETVLASDIFEKIKSVRNTEETIVSQNVIAD